MKEKMVKHQIKFMCDFNDIECDENFINYVYDKHLKEFSGEILKETKKEYEGEK